MRGAALPAGLLCAMLGLMLAFAPRRVAMIGAVLLVVVALGALQVDVPANWVDATFLACWASLIAIGIAIYLPWPPRRWTVLALAANAGLWTGLLIAGEGVPRDVLRALPAVLLVLPATWCVERGYWIAPRVVASWLLAVGLLAATIPLLTVHPGYQPDHME